MKKKILIAILIVCSVIFAFIVFLVILGLVADKIQAPEKNRIPDKDDLSSGILDYLDDLDAEEKQNLIDEAVSGNYPVEWPVLWIVVKRINLDERDTDKNITHFDIEMSDEESDYLLNTMSERFARRVNEYTDGLVNVKITPLLYGEVNYLNDDGSTIALDPKSFPDIADTFTNYNTVICTARMTSEGGPSIDTGCAGCAFCYPLPGNYGFAQVPTSEEPSYEEPSHLAEFRDNPVPEEVYIHEWLHTFEDFEEKMLDCDGNPDCAFDYGYECQTSFGMNGFYEYYKDLLNGRVADKKNLRFVGMNEKPWRTFAMLMDIAKDRSR